MILISEVKESGNVEPQLGHVLEKEKDQTETAHAAAETRQAVCHRLEWSMFWDILSMNIDVPLGSSCICRCFMSWTLTLINRVRRRAADTDRCTAADGKAPPEKQTHTAGCLPRLWQSGDTGTIRPIDWHDSPCVLSGSRALARRGASRPAE